MRHPESAAIFFIFLVGFLVGLLFNPSDPKPIRVMIEPTTVENVSPPAPEPVRSVTVAYEVEYGSFYTGDQTPLVYYGTKELAVSSLGIGKNGLPIEVFAPTSACITFDMNGRRATLYVPTGEKEVAGLLRFDNPGRNAYLMAVKVARRADNVMVVRAVPSA
ncbi:MAG: hypothetical protein V1656_01855 [Candidatus Jorgensenbacteria bacterium]